MVIALTRPLATNVPIHPHQKVVVIKEDGNQYSGLATVQTRKGTVRDVPVKFPYDGKNSIWECGPGAFVFPVIITGRMAALSVVFADRVAVMPARPAAGGAAHSTRPSCLTVACRVGNHRHYAGGCRRT